MINYSYLRPKKGEALRNWHESGFCKREKIEAKSYSKAIILPIKKDDADVVQFGKGGVIAEGDYVLSSGIENRIFGGYNYSCLEISSDRVVYCGYWVKQWGHFLVEGVARLWYAFENDPTIDKYVFISEENGPTEMYGNYLEFIQLLGIADKVEIINKPVQYETVIVPELSYSRKYYYSEQYKKIFDTIAKNALQNMNDDISNLRAPDRIFLSRSHFTKARHTESGIDFLDHFFSKNGFEILHPEKITLSQLIFYLQNAKICAASSGTVPHNFLFAQSGKDFIIVERQTTVNEIQANLDIVCNANTIYIDGHFSLYPVSAGYGPYMFGYTECMEKFTNENGYLPPDNAYCSRKFLKHILKNYLTVYKQTYGLCSAMEDWQLMYADAIYEAYISSLPKFKIWLSQSEPLYIKQYFSLKTIKSLIKKLIKRFTI